MHVSPWNVAFQVVNFIVLAALLNHFLFRRVRAVLAKRQSAVQEALRGAEETQRQAEVTIEEYRSKSAHVADEAARARDLAVASAEQEATRVRDEAKRLASALVERAKTELERERAEALRTLEARATELAVAMATRLLRDLRIDPETPFIGRVLSTIDALDAVHKDALARQIRDDTTELVSASALDAPSRERFERWLTTFAGRPVHPSYTVDASLLAGIELRLGTGVWRAHWRDSLERLGAELLRHEQAAA